jgi:hypothetical protein
MFGGYRPRADGENLLLVRTSRDPLRLAAPCLQDSPNPLSIIPTRPIICPKQIATAARHDNVTAYYLFGLCGGRD